MMEWRRCFTAGLLALSAVTSQAAAQEWNPSKPIRLVTPYAPGGSSEIIARQIAQEMSKSLGQQVYLESKPGGAGGIAMSEVAKAPADGHTLALVHVGTMAVNPYMFSKLSYKTDQFAPVSLMAQVPMVYVVNASVPVHNVKELAALAKAKPDAMNYGSAGTGSAGHFVMAYLEQVAGFNITHVPYKGTGPQLLDLLAGRTQVAASGAAGLMQHIRSGALRAIGITSEERAPALPNVPTIIEQGYPGFSASQWFGLAAPAGTPAHIVKRLGDAAAAAAKLPATREKFATDGAIAVGSTPAEFANFIKSEQARWSEVIKKANIKGD